MSDDPEFKSVEDYKHFALGHGAPKNTDFKLQFELIQAESLVRKLQEEEEVSADFADESGQFVVRQLGKPLCANGLHRLGTHQVKKFMKEYKLEPDAEGINRDYMRMDKRYVVVMCRSTTGVVVGVAYEKEIKQ